MQHLSFRPGAVSHLWNDRLAVYRHRLPLSPATVLVVEPDPLDFLAATIAAVEVQTPVILGNPQWSVAEWQGVVDLQLLDPHQGDRIWGTVPPLDFPALPHRVPLPQGAILIATGGSSGLLRFAHHTGTTLQAAVQGLQRSNLLKTNALSSCCLLPLHHVSGFMQFMRSFLTQGDFILSSSREILSSFETLAERESLTPNLDKNLESTLALIQHIDWETYSLSLVPTQLHRFITELPPAGLDWLRRFALIFVGGAALPDSLREQARSLQLPLAPTYGMTETAGMVATLSPHAFLTGNHNAGNYNAGNHNAGNHNAGNHNAGNHSVGRLLPHCQVQFCPSNTNQLKSEDDQDLMASSPASTLAGRITIRSESLALGYYPPDDHLQHQVLLTNDRGWIGPDHFLYIAGRVDRVIITGGENVNPEQVEAILLQTGLLTDVAVIGSPHPDWGEQVVAVCVGVQDWTQLKTIATQHLSPPQRPKVWLEPEALPRNDRGKLLSSDLRKWVREQLALSLSENQKGYYYSPLNSPIGQCSK